MSLVENLVNRNKVAMLAKKSRSTQWVLLQLFSTLLPTAPYEKLISKSWLSSASKLGAEASISRIVRYISCISSARS